MAAASDPAAAFVTVVSGLPRSGTSMLMQMLEAGGLPLLTDGVRKADANNPRGYYEHEAVRRLGRDARWLDGALGRGVKIVAPLLPRLGAGRACRVVFMERELDEVLASQAAMLARLGRAADEPSPEKLQRAFAAQLREVKDWLARQPRVSTLFVRYGEALAAPDATAAALSDFLGGGLDSAAMAPAVERSLYRQRGVAACSLAR